MTGNRHSIPISIFPNERTTIPSQQASVTWEEVVELHAEHDVRTAKSGRMLGGFAVDGARSNANVAARSLIQLDIDSVPGRAAPELSAVRTAIDQFAWCAASTHGHAPGTGVVKYRICMLPDRDYGRDEHLPLLEGLNELLGGILDRGAWQWSQAFFLPSCPPQRRTDAFSIKNIGIAVPVDQFVRRGLEITAATSRWATALSTAVPPSEGVPETVENITEVQAMLGVINPDIDRTTWRQICWAVMATGWPHAEDLVREWSMKGRTFTEKDFANVIRDFDPSRGTGFGTLVYFARQHGWGRGHQPPSPTIEGETCLDAATLRAHQPVVMPHRYLVYLDGKGDMRVLDTVGRQEWSKGTLISRIGREQAQNLLKNSIVYDGLGCDLGKPYGAILTKADGRNLINVFRGTNVRARPGDCRIILEFIRHLGSNEPEFSDYLLKMVAWKWQNISKPTRVALVLRSDDEGTGKGTLCRLLEQLFSPCTFTTSKSKHIVGNFNKHMEGVAILIADEAMFAADTRIRGELYSLITEPVLTIEGKGKDPYQADNPLMVVLTTNSIWAIPAGTTARRFAVNDVPTTHVADHAYWTKVYAAIDNPAVIAAFAHHLEGIDLRGWHPSHHVPVTTALQRQKALTAKRSIEGYLLECLERGEFIDHNSGFSIQVDSPGRRTHFGDPGAWARGNVILRQDHRASVEASVSTYLKVPASAREVCAALVNLLGGIRKQSNGERLILVPQLVDARQHFEAKTGYRGSWNDWEGTEELAEPPLADNVFRGDFGAKPESSSRKSPQTSARVSRRKPTE